MELLLPFTLLFFATALGWLLGRRSQSRSGGAGKGRDDAYYHSLRFLLSEQPGTAVDEFIQAIAVNEQTLDTHLSLARLMRGKGELEAATRIHQNLLARPNLPKSGLQQVHLELAKDYISAGLHDRAERLLRDLVAEASENEAEALDYLQQIYQAEKDWEKAIAVARRRLPKRGWLLKQKTDSDPQVSVALSHYYCELADERASAGDWTRAKSILQKAREADAENPRAAMSLAKLVMDEQPEYALNLLHAVAEGQPAYASEILPLFRDAFSRLADAPSYSQALRALAQVTQSSTLHNEVAKDFESLEAARAYLKDAVSQRPTIKLLLALLERELDASESGREIVSELHSLCASRPSYCCRHCGFSGRKQHWLCPSCEQWGTIAPIRSSQGD